MDVEDQLAALSLALARPLLEAFLAEVPKSECSATKLGKEALKDPTRVARIIGGVQPRLETMEKLIARIEDYRPGFTKKFIRKQLVAGGS